MMSRVSLLLALLLCGCGPYVEVQSRLVEQVRAGVAELEGSLEQKSQIVRSHYAQQRRRLDDAFDADVRARRTLDPDWVIEHRRAYAAALDVLGAAGATSARATDADRANLAAVRDALDRLDWLQDLSLRFTSLGREDRP